MIRKAAIIIALGLLAATGLAQNQDEKDKGRTTSGGRTSNTVQLLNQRIPELSFVDLPLDQVVDWLTDFTKINISVRWQTLIDAGVERDKPISIQARNLRLSQILWMIMNEAGGPDLKMAYRASGNLLIISTEEDLSKELITKIYDVSDLLIRLPRAVRQGAFNVTQGLGQNTGGAGGGGGGGAGSSMFGQGQGQQGQGGQYGQDRGGGAAGGNDVQMQELVDLIQQTVEPDSWQVNGGQGHIMPFQRSIVVRNTILVHQRLGGFVTEEDVMGQ